MTCEKHQPKECEECIKEEIAELKKKLKKEEDKLPKDIEPHCYNHHCCPCKCITGTASWRLCYCYCHNTNSWTIDTGTMPTFSTVNIP